MPSPAARLANISSGDLHPLELGRRGEHLLEQRPISRLHASLLGKRLTRFADPRHKLVTQTLQLAKIEDSRLGCETAHAVLDCHPAEALPELAG